MSQVDHNQKLGAGIGFICKIAEHRVIGDVLGFFLLLPILALDEGGVIEGHLTNVLSFVESNQFWVKRLFQEIATVHHFAKHIVELGLGLPRERVEQGHHALAQLVVFHDVAPLGEFRFKETLVDEL